MNIMQISIPFLSTGNRTIDKAFRIAVGDLLGNIYPHRAGLLKEARPVILAGIHYSEPWIRDAAFNVWNGASLLVPEVSRDTLLSTIKIAADGVPRVGYHDPHYWDAIISITGFWHHFLYTGDRAFLALALPVARNSMAYFEATEFDPDDGLFRGPACCMDALSAYPDQLAYPVRKKSDYKSVHGCLQTVPRDRMPGKGFGLPFKALSTNCLYYEAYRNLERMAAALKVAPDPAWRVKAAKLKKAINARFWLADKGHYAYLVSCPNGPEKCAHQEALGHSFAILFGIASAAQQRALFANQHTTPAGVPYLWPTFPRYKKYGAHEYGRASGTVWPHAQAFWANAACASQQRAVFLREFLLMAEHAERDSHFAEVLHPETGEIYGGVQEVNFTSKPRQTWCVTGFIRLVLRGLLGMDFRNDGISFAPCLPDGVEQLTLTNLRYRRANLQIRIAGSGSGIASFVFNGKKQSRPFVPSAIHADTEIRIELKTHRP